MSDHPAFCDGCGFRVDDIRTTAAAKVIVETGHIIERLSDGYALSCAKKRAMKKQDRRITHWYAAQVHQRREDDPAVVTALLAYRSLEQAKAAVEAMHLVGAEGRDAYVWPPDEAATLSRLPRSQAAYRAIEDEVRRRWGET